MKNRRHDSYVDRHSRDYGNGVLYFSGEVESGDGRTPYVFRLSRWAVAIQHPHITYNTS